MPIQLTGSLDITGSLFLNGTAVTASGGGGGTVDTGSLMVTGSVTTNVLTFTKGDGSTFALTVDTGSAVTVDTGSFYVSSSVTDATITFNQGDGTTEAVTVNNVQNAVSASFATSASFAPSTPAFPFTGSAVITGSLSVTGSTGIVGSVFATGGITTKTGLNLQGASGIVTVTLESDGNGNLKTKQNSASINKTITLEGFANLVSTGTTNGTTISGSFNSAFFSDKVVAPSFTGSLLGTASFATNALSASYAPSTPAFPFIGDASITGDLSVTGSYLRLSGSFSGSVIDNITDVYTSSPAIEHVISLTQAEYNTISGSADPNTLYYITDAVSTVVSASYAESASFAVSSSYALSSSFATTASFYSLASVDQDVVITGSVRGNVSILSVSSNTASLDLSTGNFYTLALTSGSDTFVNPSNILPGQTINLRITQPDLGFGTVSFPSSVKQVSGSAYVPTAEAFAQDIVTFISFDSTSLYLSNVKNLV